MSTALAVAGVTAVLRDLLNDGLINHNTAGVLGSSVLVRVGPPDRVLPASGTEASQLNIFMYHVTPNTGWRNEGLPARDASGRHRLSNPPLAINLHYLISAHGSEDLHAEVLLGYAMQLLHESPVLTRAAIQRALNPSPLVADTVLPATLKALADSGLENQVEQIKITPEFLNTEEISKIWTATQSHLRPTAAYMASVVLIEGRQPTRASLPVLTRGRVDPATGRETGVVVQPDLLPPIPTLDEVRPHGGQPAVVLETTIELRGHHLGGAPGTGRVVLLASDRFAVSEEIAAAPPADGAGSITFSLPAGTADKFPVGVYSVGVRVQVTGEAAARETNRLALTIAPKILGLPRDVPAAGGSATFTLDILPAMREGQRVALVLGQTEYDPAPWADGATTLTFTIADPPLTVDGELARLRIDGIESPIIDRTATPPAFLEQRIRFTP